MTNTSSAILSGAVTTLVGAVVGFFLEPMKAWFFGPRLVVRFDPNDGKHVADSPALLEWPSGSPQTVQSRWVRISVENRGRSHLSGAEAFVVAIDREQDGRWLPTSFIDPLRLPWSASESETRDLPRGVPFFVDVCRAAPGTLTSATSDTFGIAARIAPMRIQSLFSEPGRYRITVTVTGHMIKPATQSVIVTWTGVWNKLQAASG